MSDLNSAAERGKSKRGPKSLDDEVRRDDKNDRKPVRYTIDLPPDLHREFKVKSAQESRTMKDVMIEALEAYLRE